MEQGLVLDLFGDALWRIVIIVSVIASFGIPSYKKNYERGLMKAAISQLKSINQAQKMFHQRYEYYYPADGAVAVVDTINNDLKVHLITNGFVYACTDTDNSDDKYTCTATRDVIGYIVQVTESSDPACISSCP